EISAPVVLTDCLPTDSLSTDTPPAESLPADPILTESILADSVTVDGTSTDDVSLGSLQTDTNLVAPPASISPTVAAVPAERAPVNLQTIANAYGNYAMKSLDQTRSFLEKLAGARSLNKAFELQTEFAREACNTFVAESLKIRELYGELARQRLKRVES